MDDDVQPQPQPDWQGNPPPAPTGPPPSWGDIKAAPEFAQLNPNQQITAFQHWRSVASNHASSLPGYDQNVQQEFNEASNPEQQRLATAAQQFNTQHPDLPGLVQPPTEAEGFWGTAGRALASGIGPAAGQAAGAELGGVIGAAAGAPEGGVGAIPGAILGAGAGGLGAGLLAENAQKSIMGDEWYNRNRQQMELNAKAHPYAHQIGTLIPFLVSAFTGAAEAQGVSDLVGKVVSEESPKLARVLGGGAERVITGGLGGARAGALSEVEQKGQITPETVATGAGRGAVTMGAVGIFPAMKTILGQAIKGIPDSYVMATAGEVYDASIEHRPVDFKKISQEGGGGIAPFALQNALLGALHGMPLRARSGEAPPPEATTPTKPEIEAALVQRQKDLEAQKAQGTITPDQQKELDDHNTLLGMTQGEAAPPVPAAPTTPEAAPPTTSEAAPPVPAPTAELPPEKQDLVNKVNEGLEATTDNRSRLIEQIVQKSAASVGKPDSPQAEELRQKLQGQTTDQLNSSADYWSLPRLPTETVQGGLAAGEQPAPHEAVMTDEEKVRFRTRVEELTKAGTPRSQAWTQAAQEIMPANQIEADIHGANREAENAPKPTDEQRQAVETQAKTMSTELLQQEISKPDAGYHDIIQAELDRRANAPATPEAAPAKPAEPTAKAEAAKEKIARAYTEEQVRAGLLPTTSGESLEKHIQGRVDELMKNPAYRASIQEEVDKRTAATTETKATAQTAEERQIAKTEAEKAKTQAVQDLDAKMPPEHPFPNKIVFKTRDREIAGKQIWLDHIENPEKDFKLPELQKALGRDAGTALYHELQPSEVEATRTGRTVPLDEGRVGEVPTQAEEQEAGHTTPELTQQAEAPTEEAATSHEQVLKDFGIADPQAALDRTNEIARKKGVPEKTMQDLAEAMQKAEKMTRQAPTDSGIAAGKTVRTESSVPINPIRVLENTQKLDNIGALDDKDPVGSGLRGLAEKGTAVQKFIAKLLLNSGIDTSKIKLSFDNKMAQKALYEYDGKKGFNIYLNLNSDHSASSIYGALLHEALHHVTVWKLLPGYVPNAHEAVAIQSLDRLLTRGRQAAWKESFGRTGTKEELAEFTKWLNNPNDTSVKLSNDQLFKLYDNYSKFYGLANTKELVAEITNPELVDFLGRLPADTSIKGRALNLLHQARNMIMQLVSGRPVEQQDNIQKYFESVAALTQEAPTHVGKAEIGLRSNAIQENEVVEKLANKMLGETLPVNIVNLKTGEVVMRQGEKVTKDMLRKIVADPKAEYREGGANHPTGPISRLINQTLVSTLDPDRYSAPRMAESAGLSPDEIDRIKKGMIPAGNRFLYSMAPYNPETNRLGDKHTLPKSGEIDETAFAKVGGVGKPLNKAEIALYKTIVPQAFQNGKVNVRTLDQGLRTRGPTVETKKLGGPAESPTAEKQENARLVHELDTKLPNWRSLASNEVPPEYQDIYNRQYQLSQNIGTGVYESNTKYEFIGPKSEEQMPGYVEGLVRLPSANPKTISDLGVEGVTKEAQREAGIKYMGPHFGADDKNVLSFYRGYEETLPDGSKAFHVIEVQSDWAQRVRNEKTTPEEAAGRRSIGGNVTEHHPLLQVYEQLALKAAIQHAKEIGASKVILSDAETAMMTEGHDRTGMTEHRFQATPENVARAKELLSESNNWLENRGWFRTDLEKLARGDDLHLDLGARHDDIQDLGLTRQDVNSVPQAKGMRLHYDQTLPSAMEKITGQKGEAVDLGVHKSGVGSNYDQLGRLDVQLRDGRITQEQYDQGIAALKKGEPIGSPVFKNAEGNPKTNITGKLYDLVKTPDEFTLTDRLLIAAGLSPEELPKSKGKYAVIMRDAGVPYVGNFLGTHEQMAKDAQDELAKNPNAAEDRLNFLVDHKAVPSAEDFHLFRAKVSEIRREEVAARVKGDIPAANAAAAKEKNWMTRVYNKTAEAGKSLQAVQGALDINTGDFFDLRSYFKMVYGKDFTPEMEKDAQKIVQDTTQARVDTLKSDIKMGQEIAKTAEGTVKELGKLAEGTKLTSAEKKAAKTAGVETKKTPDGKDTGQLEFGFDYDPADAGKKLSQYLQARFEAKPFRPGQKNLTIREVGNIWKFIKANYLQGTEYVRPDELVKQVSADLGLNDTRIIKEAIASPKTIRALSDARYAAQSQQRAITNATKAWFEQNSRGTALKWAANLWEAPRSLAVIGHVNPSLTHAGSLLFRPSRWGSEIPSIGQAFNASFFKSMTKWATGEGENSQVYHERLMQGVMNTVDNADGENMYAKLTRLGLAAKVGTLDDIGQYNTKLGKIGVAGNRGMDILKALRMDLGAKEYKVLKGKDWFNALDQDNKDDVLREMVSRINSETGTTTAGFTHLGDFLSGRGRGDWRTFLFAPKLEGARWQQMVIDPFRAAGLWLKAGSATPAEKYFRNKVTLRSAELAGTYLAALTANAAILHAVGSDDKVNFLDPTRSDWLAFKVNGQTVIAPSSFLAPLRLGLSVALAHVIPAENRQPYTDKIINYAMGKVTPTISDIVEIARAKQNYTGRPIEALQNLYEKAGVKFATPKNPKDPISLYEWAATKGPIPLSATVEGWYNAMVSQGSSPELAKTIIGASIALVSSVFAVHQHPTTPTKETNP